MAQVLIELNEGGVFRRKFVDADSVAVWAEAGWSVPPDSLVDGQATGYDAAVADAIQRVGSLTKAAIDERVTAVGDATYVRGGGAAQLITGPTLPTLPTGTEYVWNKTDGAGNLLDILSGVA
jgi:hypothetical protein